MKILLVDNAYQHHGGEEAVVSLEERALAEKGYSIVRYRRHNDELKTRGAMGTVSAGIETVWSSDSYKQLQKVIERERPDIAHFHNTFPLISPAAYYVCNRANIPVVQTLHNYRLLCPGTTFFRDGQVCQLCLGHASWPSIVHGCYRGSRAQSAVTTAMLAVHRTLNTWQDKVDVYIALSEFARNKFIEGGLPAERIVVRPNFVHPDPGLKTGNGEYALFAGRLVEEKGIRPLLRAWKLLSAAIPLLIAGEGPLREEMQNQAVKSGLTHVSFLGGITRDAIFELMRGARFLVFPSRCFENFPLSIVESMACGLPVLVSNRGAMPEIIEHGRTGLHFQPEDASDLASKVQWAWTNPQAVEVMGRAARVEYEQEYSAGIAMERLAGIYARALRGRAVDQISEGCLTADNTPRLFIGKGWRQ